MEGAAPRSVNYTDTLPLAIPSTQNRRSYYPVNGQKFQDTNSNIIRIDVNADGMLDVQQSYLEFTLVNDSGTKRALDQGHCWIKRLTIESAGVILEDINNYNKLVGAILQPAQGSAAYTGEVSLAQFAGVSTTHAVLGTDGATAAFAVPSFQNSMPRPGALGGTNNAAEGQTQTALNGTGVMGPATTGNGGNNPQVALTQVTGQYHLVCGFLNMDKYLPLVLMGQGFTIQLELEVGNAIGTAITQGNGDPNPAAQSYTIQDVKYVAHIVEMQRDFYDMLRNLQAQSGGSLMIGGSTYRHFSHAYKPNNGTTEDINISARVRSLESLLWTTTRTNNLTSNKFYSLSNGSTFGAARGTFNVFVGSVRYPSNQVSWDTVANKGEAYQELRKCFGALGSINHGGLLNSSTYLSSTTGEECNADSAAASGGGTPRYSPMGISFKSWRHELEDGIDTSSRALPIRLSITTNGVVDATVQQTVDIFAQATVLFYFNMDGSVSASV